MLKPIAFDINGEEHEQTVYYNVKDKEAILYSPPHSGYPAITTVVTSKSGEQKAKSLTCNDDTCHLNDVLDELYLDPEIIAHVYKLRENSSKSRKFSVDNGVKTNYVVRSNHHAPSQLELQELPESMKAVSRGKSILVSDVTIESEKPDTEFTFGASRKKRAGGWCGDKVKKKINLQCHKREVFDFSMDVAAPMQMDVLGHLLFKQNHPLYLMEILQEK